MKKQMVVHTVQGTLRSDPSEMTEVQESECRAYLENLGRLTSFTMIINETTYYLNPAHIVHVYLIDYNDTLGLF